MPGMGYIFCTAPSRRGAGGGVTQAAELRIRSPRSAPQRAAPIAPRQLLRLLPRLFAQRKSIVTTKTSFNNITLYFATILIILQQ